MTMTDQGRRKFHGRSQSLTDPKKDKEEQHVGHSPLLYQQQEEIDEQEEIRKIEGVLKRKTWRGWREVDVRIQGGVLSEKKGGRIKKFDLSLYCVRPAEVFFLFLGGWERK